MNVSRDEEDGEEIAQVPEFAQVVIRMSVHQLVWAANVLKL